MVIPTNDPGWGYNETARTAQTVIDKTGYLGKFKKALTITDETVYCTGSLDGASGFIKKTGATGNIDLMASGSIDIADLTVGPIYDLSIKTVTVAGTSTLLFGLD